MSDIVTKFITSEKLPLVIEPVDQKMTFNEFKLLLHRNNAFIKKSLLKYGGVLFRNFPASGHCFRLFLFLSRVRL